MKIRVESIVCMAIVGVVLSGCMSDPFKSITNTDSSACQRDIIDGTVNILKKQKQFKNENRSTMRSIVANKLDGEEAMEKQGFELSYWSSHDIVPSSTEGYSSYKFAFTGSGNSCYLRLYSRTSGNFTYTNTLTFIESEKLQSCQCQ